MENKLPHCHDLNEERLLDNIIDIKDFKVIADMFKQLSDPTRVKIFWILCHVEECVTNISALMDMTSAAVSFHLRQLKAYNLIESRREGKEVYYRVCDNKEAKFLHGAIEMLMDIKCPKEN